MPMWKKDQRGRSVDADVKIPSGMIYTIGSSRPRIGDAVWIAPGAFVIGDVTIGEGSSVWFNCVLRGDTNTISIGRRSNIQDGTIIHVDPGLSSTTIGDDVTVGHGCIIHGCTLMDRVLVGMGAIILNGATIESDGMLAAGAVLTSGKRVQKGELWAGAPAKLLRTLTEAERRGLRENADHYLGNARRFRKELDVSR